MPARLLLCLALVALGCGQYGAEGSSQPRTASGDLSRPTLLSGEPIDLRSSGCELSADRHFIVRFRIRTDGSTDDLEFTEGEPSDCVRSFIAGIVADWTFEPSRLDGELVEVYHFQTVSYRQ